MSVSLRQLQDAAKRRTKVWFDRGPKPSKLGVMAWSPERWATAVGGEAGELLNKIKKLFRFEDGLNQDPVDHVQLMQEIADEAGDVAVYLSLLCARMGIDFEEAVVSKFNEVSAKYDFKERL